MALIDDIIAATDTSSIAAVNHANAAIAAINATRANVAAAVADGGTASAVKAHISDEDTTTLDTLPVPTIDKAVGQLSGPADPPTLVR